MTEPTPMPRNPFSAQSTSSMEEHVLDSALTDWETTGPTYELPHVRQLAAAIERYLAEFENGAGDQGQAVFVRGSHGSGKTHTVRFALGRISSGTTTSGVIRLYHKAEDDDFLSVYQRLMSQLGRPQLRELALRFRSVLATEKARGSVEETDLIDAARRDPEKVPALYRAMLVEPGQVLEVQAEELAKVAADSADFERALDALLNPNLEQQAYDWLVGREIDLVTASRLGVEGPILDPARARFGLQLLAAICARVTQPLIIVIDQCERLVRNRAGRTHIPNIGVLHSLVERLPSEQVMFILLGNNEAWNAFPPDLQQRFGANVLSIEPLNPSDAGSLLRSYTEGQSGQPLRLEPGAIQMLLSLSGGNIRQLLQLAWVVHERAEHDGGQIDSDFVAAATDREQPSREILERALERLLQEAGLDYEQEWHEKGVRADYAVVSKHGPRLLIQIVDAQFDAEFTRSGLEAVNNVDLTRALGWKAQFVIVVLGYAGPHVLEVLRGKVNEVMVYQRPADLEPVEKLVRRLNRSASEADEVLARRWTPRTRRWFLAAWSIGVLGVATTFLIHPVGGPTYASILLASLQIPLILLARPNGRALTRLGAMERRYRRRLRTAMADMETIGIATQGEFVLRSQQVMVDVALSTRPAAAAEASLGNSVASGTRLSLSDLLTRTGTFALISGPGTGKTTLLRSIALSLSSDTGAFWRRSPLPVLLVLRDHATAMTVDEPPTLATMAASVSWLGGAGQSDLLESRLNRGQCVVLLDGLDEVADEGDRRSVVKWTQRQIDRYPGNTFLITSRPHGYVSNPLSKAEVLQLLRWDDKQIDAFVHRWYYAITSRAYAAEDTWVQERSNRDAEDVLQRLRARPALHDLASNPLLLTMIANVHRYRGALPGSRAELYAEMCDVLLHRRQEAKNIANPTGLGGNQKEHVIQHLALYMMQQRRRDIPMEAALSVISAPLARLGGGAVTASDFLTEIGRSGLLLEREQGIYAFAHLTLQEYLAANQLRASQSGLETLVHSVGDSWWRETTLLWAAAADATPVIVSCLDTATVPALSLAFDCADEAREVAPEVRRRLDALLEAGTGPVANDVDGARRRLVTGVVANRNLQDQIRLESGAALCVRPINQFLYQSFVEDERAAGRHYNRSQPEGEALGLWASDTGRFLEWLNALFDEGTAYRLPTANELSSSQSLLGASLSHASVWFGDTQRPKLWVGGATPWPYHPGPRFGALIRGHLSSCVRLLSAPTDDRQPGTQAPSLKALFNSAQLHRLGQLVEDPPNCAELDTDTGLSLSLTPHLEERLEIVTRAIRDLVQTWAPRGVMLNAARSFETFLERRLSEALGDVRPSEDPAGLLANVIGDVDRETPALDALEIITPLLDRSMAFNQQAVAIAVIELVSVVLRRTVEDTTTRPLAQVVLGLIAMGERERGGLDPNDVLVLVRD
ncbi:NACHT domain-containing protein [Streptomyces sp. S3(2020)]|uniref:NACHT domain-containing protein n=1 Tax=Streptomyces sp. S3(2020) TaxID=2732044 RepID=UPI001487D20B|nr:NACHT domain-containing protein [Streptomyces sp. S3(2020)]NNN32185.1 NACHT domain-containing protein [Streptomyces sp. S3(2020)]